MIKTDRVRYQELQGLLNLLIEDGREILQIIPTNDGERFVVISIKHPELRIENITM